MELGEGEHLQVPWPGCYRNKRAHQVTTMLSNVNGAGGTVPDDLDLSVSLGNHTGWRILRKFAMNPDVDTGRAQVWPPGTIQVLPAAAGVVSVVSDSANDVMTTGTGCWTVKLWGLDANYEEINETVELNGTSAVITTQEFLRVYRAYAVQVGTGEVNDGNISFSIGGNLQAYIEANEGQTHISQYTVPLGHVAVITRYVAMSGRVGNADLSVQLQVRLLGESWRSFSDTFPYEGSFTLERPMIVVPEKADIRAIVAATTTNSNVAIDWNGFLIDEKYFNGQLLSTVAP